MEKHLAAKGLAGTTVTWARLAGPSAIVNSFLAGAVHFSGQGVPSTALIWDRTRNGIGAKAVSAMVASNIWLMTRKPELKSLRDLTDKDRIALPSIKTSSQALFLWTAAEKEFGAGTVGQARPPDGVAAASRCHGRRAQSRRRNHRARGNVALCRFGKERLGCKAITDLYSVEGGAVTGLNFVSTESSARQTR